MTNILKSSVIPQKKVGKSTASHILSPFMGSPQDLERSLITIAMPKERKVSVNEKDFQ